MVNSRWTPRIRRVATGNEQERLIYAASLLRERKFEEAGEELRRILDQNERSLGATMGLGVTYLATKKPQEALSCFQKAMEIDPMDAQAPLRAGFAALGLSERDQAAAYFATALELDPSQSNAHLGLAIVLQKDDDPQPALDHARAALRGDPELNFARILIAQLQRKSGNLDVAIEELESLLHAHPGQPAASVLLASMYSESDQDERALKLLETTSKLRPDQAGVWSLQGRLRMKTKDYAGAEQAFRQAATLRTKDVFGPLRIVEALIPQGKYDEAAELLQKVPRRGPAAAMSFKYHGDIYAARKIYDEAVSNYRAAMLKSKDGQAAVAELEAELGERIADPKVAVEKYQAAVQKLTDQAREKLLQRDFQSTARQMQPGAAGGWQREPGGRRFGGGGSPSLRFG
jgi:tetratricopeptide (TPR) repeat protein